MFSSTTRALLLIAAALTATAALAGSAGGAGGASMTRSTAAVGYATNNGFPAWSPDGSRIAFTSARDGHDHLSVMNADGPHIRRVTNEKTRDFAPSWAPTGMLVFPAVSGSSTFI